MDQKKLNFADITTNDIESLNNLQNEIKTKDGKEIVLLAYTK